MKKSPSPSRWRLLFCLKEMAAVVEDTGSIEYYEGYINPIAEQCIVSFPGKYQSGWEALINENASHGQSVACVFLCTPGSGLGEHEPDPEDDQGRCYCSAIYGGNRDYQTLGYLKKLPKDTDEATEVEEKRKAECTGTVVIREDADIKEIHEAEEKAKKACKDNGNRASWGCAWFKKWKENVEIAVECNQQLKVVFFPGQVGKGKVNWDDLPKEDLWNGVGCGGSQKSEIAYLEKEGYEYTSIDAIHFLRAEFQCGKEVIAWDGNDEEWIRGNIVETPKAPRRKTESEQTPQSLQCVVACSKTGHIFTTHQVRHCGKMQDFLEAVGEYPFLKMVDQTLKKNAKVVGSQPKECTLPNGEVSGPGFGQFLNIEYCSC